MTKTARALAWATVILGLALATIFDFVSGDLARTLLIVLPLVAWMNISGQAGCVPRKAERA